MRITRAIVFILGATLVSCSENTTEPTVGASGSLSFTYTGAGATSAAQYAASGAMPSNFGINNGSQPWAAGAINATDNTTIVYAFVPKGGSSWDWSFININRTTVGASTIDPSCSADSCTEFGVWFGMNQNGTNYTYICTLTSGSVNISAISATNVTGTFSGSGTCAAAGSTTPSNFTVTNGSFDVGITTALE